MTSLLVQQEVRDPIRLECNRVILGKSVSFVFCNSLANYKNLVKRFHDAIDISDESSPAKVNQYHVHSCLEPNRNVGKCHKLLP